MLRKHLQTFDPVQAKSSGNNCRVDTSCTTSSSRAATSLHDLSSLETSIDKFRVLPTSSMAKEQLNDSHTAVGMITSFGNSHAGQELDAQLPRQDDSASLPAGPGVLMPCKSLSRSDIPGPGRGQHSSGIHSTIDSCFLGIILEKLRTLLGHSALQPA